MQRKLPTPRHGLTPLLAVVFIFCAAISKADSPAAKIPNLKNMTTQATLTPYLLLDGTCKAAMEFYQACLGGELTLTTVGDSPMKDVFPASMHHKVVNARLVSRNFSLSASDWLRPQQTPVQGNTVCLYLSGGSYQELKTAFDRLAEGAHVTDPLKEKPFGVYGALTDKFGIRWMFHAAKQD